MEKWAAKHSASSSSDVIGANGEKRNGEAQTTSDFVAAFGQANVGDTSPNIQGAFCRDTGKLQQCPSSLETLNDDNMGGTLARYMQAAAIPSTSKITN